MARYADDDVLAPSALTSQVRRTRADQLQANRTALIRAAIQVVGEAGYSKASVVKITSLAGLGQGTFYTYFSSRQELFNMLLPQVGEDMLGIVRNRLAHWTTVADMEEHGYRAFTDYVQENPSYVNLLMEAEAFAPAAAVQHARSVAAQHQARLERAWENGELRWYRKDELGTLSSTLLSLRRHFVRSRVPGSQLLAPMPNMVEVTIRMIRRLLERD